jgi:hypothetical protein
MAWLMCCGAAGAEGWRDLRLKREQGVRSSPVNYYTEDFPGLSRAIPPSPRVSCSSKRRASTFIAAGSWEAP